MSNSISLPSWLLPFLYLKDMFSRNSEIHQYNTRGRNNIHMSKISSKSDSRSFSYAAANFFNNLSAKVTNVVSISSFIANYWQNFNRS